MEEEDWEDPASLAPSLNTDIFFSLGPAWIFKKGFLGS